MNEFLATLIIIGFIASVITLLCKLAENSENRQEHSNPRPHRVATPPNPIKEPVATHQTVRSRWTPQHVADRPAPRQISSHETVYLDTETTGLYGRFSDGYGKDEIVEISIVDDNGTALVNSLVRPNKITSWDSAQRIHGISPAMVANAPTLAQLLPSIRIAIKGKRVVIYNRQFDLKFLPPKTMEKAAEIHCCMEAYAQYINVWSQGEAGRQWHKLTEAAELIGYKFEGAAHRSLSDALACRAVWRWMHRETP